MDQLGALCREAAADLLAREPRPLPPVVVLPLPSATRVTALPDLPDDDAGRHDVLTAFAAQVMRPENAPAYGFVAEAAVAGEDGVVDVVAVVWGARRHPAQVAAAPLLPTPEGWTLGEWLPAEELDPAAMPFLAPLQHAADAAQPGEGTGSIF